MSLANARLLPAALLLAAAISPIANAAPVYSAVTGHYYELSTEWGSWHEMQSLASSRSVQVGNSTFTGFLACIETAEEQAAIVALFGEMITIGPDVFGAWIGASDERNEGQWEWVTGPHAQNPLTFYADGQQLTYAPWAPGEPNSFMGAPENFAVWGWGAGGTWNDLYEFGRAPALIEYIPAPASAALLGLGAMLFTKRRRT